MEDLKPNYMFLEGEEKERAIADYRARCRKAGRIGVKEALVSLFYIATASDPSDNPRVADQQQARNHLKNKARAKVYDVKRHTLPDGRVRDQIITRRRPTNRVPQPPLPEGGFLRIAAIAGRHMGEPPPSGFDSWDGFIDPTPKPNTELEASTDTELNP